MPDDKIRVIFCAHDVYGHILNKFIFCSIMLLIMKKVVFN